MRKETAKCPTCGKVKELRLFRMEVATDRSFNPKAGDALASIECNECYNKTPAGAATPAITEDEKLEKLWYHDAKKVQTTDELKAFIDRVMNGHTHDYGTVCKAVAACALAGAWCANHQKGSHGGITGFQAGAVMWEFVKDWLHIEAPLKLVDYSRMLYPQYQHEFRRSIPQSVQDWLEKKAAEYLREHNSRNTDKRVLAHWKMIAEEKRTPFNYEVDKPEGEDEEDDDETE